MESRVVTPAVCSILSKYAAYLLQAGGPLVLRDTKQPERISAAHTPTTKKKMHLSRLVGAVGCDSVR